MCLCMVFIVYILFMFINIYDVKGSLGFYFNNFIVGSGLLWNNINVYFEII